MRLVWRAAVAFADKGWPVLPWDEVPLEPFASADVEQVVNWAEQYGDSNAAVDLVRAGLFVVEVTGDHGFASLVELFDESGGWPDDGGLTVAIPNGWLWYLQQPDVPLRGGAIANGVRVVTEFALVPGSTVAGGVARVEAGADLVAFPCPPWLSRTPVAHA